MGVRQFINQQPLLAGGIAAGLVVIAIVFGVWQMTHSTVQTTELPPGDFSKGFYTDDDGNTFFDDVVKKVTPFKHNGKDAVRAYVFKCGSTVFVGYLGRNTELGRDPVNALAGGDEKHIDAVAAAPPIFEIKKRGPGAWTPVGTTNSAQWQAVAEVKCPGGSTDFPITLLPGQEK